MLQRNNDADASLIDGLQKAAFDYFLLYTNPENGLVADTSIRTSHCSIAAVGFALSSYPVGVERGWISRADAAARVATTLNFFADSHQGQERHATGYRGFYYHFLDMKHGRRAWNSELSMIDTALLLMGVLAAAAYFTGEDETESDIRAQATVLYERADWRWALNKGETISMGWKPSSGFLRWRYQGYDEAILLYTLALGSPTHPIPKTSYDAFASTYTWMMYKQQPFLYAGPLFIHLFSHAWIDFRGINDRYMAERNTDYFSNTQIAIDVQRDYAERNPGRFVGYGRDIWGLSACDGPIPTGGRHSRNHRPKVLGYAARGAPLGPDDGTIAPWCPLACLPYDRQAALDGTRALLAAYPNLLLDGRFPGGFNPSVAGPGPEGWVDDRSVGIDQGLLVMMIENDRNGLLWDLMRQSPIMRAGLARAGFIGGWLDEPAAAVA
ncbi:glucoamylase family protein [Rhizobium sp. RAF56]|uniref:glucoamylase family protein n=1 Tax=Rhizobium sp. RAF56 TaxID=3233062 RepID=UPI003F9A7CC6